MILSPALFETLVVEANLAPSVHNTQPTRWRLEPDGSVSALEDVSRRLPIGDREGRDAAVSHGAAIEGFALAASARGLSISVEPREGPVVSGLAPVARLTIAAPATVDPLYPGLATRRTYRGAFAGGAPPPGLNDLETQGDLRVLTTAEDIAFVADLNDDASLKTFRDREFRGELVSWMRFSRRDPRWDRDGLNAEAMAMSVPEAAGASVVLRPGVFEALDRVGLARLLVAERRVVASAAAIVLFHRPEGEPALQTGRRYHRAWLELERLGLSAAPMAVLADDPTAAGTLRRRFNFGPDRRLITAWRAGRSPQPAQDRRKARLRSSDLIASGRNT